MKKSVKGKLGLGFGVITILVVALGGFALYSNSQVSAVTDRIYSKNMKGLIEVNALIDTFNTMRGDVQKALLFNDDGAELAQSIDADIAKITELWNGYYPALLTGPEEKAKADQAAAKFKEFAQVVQTITEPMQTGQAYEAQALYAVDVEPGFDALIGYMDELAEYQVARAGVFFANGQATQATSRNIIIATLVAVVLLTVVTMVLLTRMITRPLDQARGLVDAIAQGRLSNDVHNPYKDEFGSMLAGLKNMQAKLSEIVSNVRQGSESVSVGAGQIASGNDELSSRTQEQAANLEETAASMEQMTSTVKQNADNAAQADQLARGVRTQASEGGEVVARAVAAMQEIDASSRKISEIVGLIDDIAFQTNLLALNASVEAARAGEQGRGFAVVASEVRNLASRSAAAAKDIKSLVEDSAAKVADGSAQVALSGKTLDGIVESVHKVGDIIAEIAAASSEQSSGIEQVNLAVSQMDSMTQQNASLVEQSAAASRSLEEQAESLKRQVAFFTLSGDARTVASVPAVSTAKTATPVAAASAAPAPAPAKPAAPAAHKTPVKDDIDIDDGDWATF
ncbi:methyl-accepting chemotaxis protein [Salinisphaera sp.]|uniref:methyl-accepting chemotaxis protein n=1 Tax=Salinisphaera sp. TaxID=1914330 RepID=UPI000C493D29|nr:methyl-accepting chemotaxis protein [Salinisphaera sp.]MBS63751.1 methyl-accepting chemotaxis protein [Salinisphaera sp.]